MRTTVMIGWFELGDLATWFGVGFSVLTAVIAGIAFRQLRLRERRQALSDLQVSLTTGETAAARNVIGTLLYSDNKRDLPSRLDSISAYFALIWALQRARNVFRAQLLPSSELNSPISRWAAVTRGRRMKDAAAMLSWNINEIAENVVRFHDTYGSRWHVSDNDAWKEMSEYLNAAAIRGASNPDVGNQGE